ncbi:hypothetical protein Tco_1263091 [Tanacetum coccineum]
MTYPCHWFSEQVGLAGDLGSTSDVLIPLVRILQKSQENWTNTDTRRKRVYKSQENAIKVYYLCYYGFELLDDKLTMEELKGHLLAYLWIS